jgi:microcystin degradation protein MlrC
MGLFHGDATQKAPDGVFGVLITWRNLAMDDGHEVVESLAAAAQPGGRTLQVVYEAFRGCWRRCWSQCPVGRSECARDLHR